MNLLKRRKGIDILAIYNTGLAYILTFIIIIDYSLNLTCKYHLFDLFPLRNCKRFKFVFNLVSYFFLFVA